MSNIDTVKQIVRDVVAAYFGDSHVFFAEVKMAKTVDPYKIGTVTDSCSTMHRIAAKEFDFGDFSYEHLSPDHGNEVLIEAFIPSECCYSVVSTEQVLNHVISALNVCREKYLETKDKVYWWQMITLLPESYNQLRTLTMNYENVVSIIRQRTGHKLTEWNEFVEILKKLPYIAEIMGEGDE